MNYRSPAQRVKMYSLDWQKEYIVDDWIHPRFWQVGTDTMRFSSSNPNIQQVPKDGRLIIGNLPGYQIVNVDYSQIEVRIAAEIAHDAALIESLKAGDAHRSIASKVFKVPEEEITFDQRRHAKSLTFALLFGGGPKLLYEFARASGQPIEMDEAMRLFNAFFTAFDGLARMRAQAYAMAKNKRVVPITLPNSGKRLLVGRTLSATRILNTMVQGSASVGLKYSLLLAHERGLTKYIGAQVHDEIVAAVPTSEADDFMHELSDVMVEGMMQAFPQMYVKVEAKKGDYWQS